MYKILVIGSALLFVLAVEVSGQKHRSEFNLKEGFQLRAVSTTFHARDHQIDTCQREGISAICLIDGKPWFGGETAVDYPRYELTELVAITPAGEILLDVTGMFNPNIHHADLKQSQFRLKTTERGVELSGLFSDGAGTYMAKWLIIKTSSIRLKLSNEEQDVDAE